MALALEIRAVANRKRATTTMVDLTSKRLAEAVGQADLWDGQVLAAGQEW